MVASILGIFCKFLPLKGRSSSAIKFEYPPFVVARNANAISMADEMQLLARKIENLKDELDVLQLKMKYREKRNRRMSAATGHRGQTLTVVSGGVSSRAQAL